MAGHLREPSVRRRSSWATVVSALAATLALGAGLLVAPAAASAPVGPLPVPTAAPRRPSPAPPGLPRAAINVRLSPANGTVVGIAYPITATFSASVANRAAAERHMRVYVNGIASHGAWYWRNSRTAVFRAQSFWPGRSRIQVRLTLAGVELNRSSTTSFVGSSATTRPHLLRTSRVLVARISATTHRMLVYVDGKVVRNVGVSLGKAGFETRSGFKAVMEKYLRREMTSIELGLTNESYDLWAPYATRITPTGEFVHGAPWAAGRIGRRNGSHGCTNLLTSDAAWFYDNTIAGDLVITTGTSRAMEYWNGIGAPYNMPWAQWLAHSALKGRF
jgi:lipoprotein-anchoring transpeptidase ErfK/SrfK